MNKEQIYDAQIHPLMAQILAVCKEHKISMIATFDTPNDDDPDLVCTSHTPDESGKFSERIRRVRRAVFENRSAIVLTIVSPTRGRE